MRFSETCRCCEYVVVLLCGLFSFFLFPFSLFLPFRFLFSCHFLSSLLFSIPHFAMVTTADPEHLSHLRHFTQYLIGSFQIKHSNCVYKSPLGFQALFLLHIHFKSNSDVRVHTHAYRQKLLITFNAKQNKQTADWFCWVRLPNHDGIIQRFLSQCCTSHLDLSVHFCLCSQYALGDQMLILDMLQSLIILGLLFGGVALFSFRVVKIGQKSQIYI